MSSTAETIAAGEAVYLYCFLEAGAGAPAVAGLDETRPVTVHRHAGLDALVSRVSLADFTGEQGEAQLEDASWVGPRALRHEAVVEAAMGTGPVYPMPFGTLFSSLSSLESTMRERREAIRISLERVAGRQEWAVQGTLDRRAAVDALLAAGLADGRFELPSSPGHRHLQEQRLRRELEGDLEQWLGQIAAILRDELGALAQGRHEERRRLTEERVINWAFLVPDNTVEKFRRQVETAAARYAGQGLTLHSNGPWPPYSFRGGEDSA